MALSARHRALTSINDDLWYQDERARILQEARARLDPEVADAAWERGAELDLEDLVGRRSRVTEGAAARLLET